MERVLAARGLAGADAAEFLEPRLTRLHEPSLIPDMDRAAERILAALDAREPVAIYGDYDADGITATAILFHTMRALAPTGAEPLVSTYVPHRLDEGYGLNVGAIEQLAAEGARVIVSVDCGITALEPALAARRAGVDLIITDHHNPPTRLEDLPAAYAVVHPRRPDSAYPFGELCGAGVAFKLAWRMATIRAGGARVPPETRALLLDLLPLAALGSIADVVPLVDENRVIVRHGLDRLRHSPLAGVRALIEASGLDGERVGSADVGFRLAPRINACGRMAHAREAVELLTTADATRSATLAGMLTMLNERRRATERAIFEQACEMAEREGMTGPDRRAILLAHPEWHAGVVGIVCSRLVERYGRPAILLASGEHGWHGSGRSIDGFNLHGALERCADLLAKFGGHDMAAGLRVEPASLPALVERFTAVCNEGISVEGLMPGLTIDAGARLDELTPAAVRALEALSPCGRGNPEPRVALLGLTLDAAPVPLGKAGTHLSLTVRQGARVMRLVAWGWGDRRADLVRGRRVHAVVTPKVSTWGGRTSVEPELRDLAWAE